MRLLNYTSATIRIRTLNSDLLRLDPHGPAPQRDEEIRHVSPINIQTQSGGSPALISMPIRMTENRFTTAVDLPESEWGTVFIVARDVAEDATSRIDLVYPGPEIRDSNGELVGYDGLSRPPKPEWWEN